MGYENREDSQQMDDRNDPRAGWLTCNDCRQTIYPWQRKVQLGTNFYHAETCGPEAADKRST